MLGSRRREELRRQRDFDSTIIGRVKTLLQVNEHNEQLFCVKILKRIDFRFYHDP